MIIQTDADETSPRYSKYKLFISAAAMKNNQELHKMVTGMLYHNNTLLFQRYILACVIMCDEL